MDKVGYFWQAHRGLRLGHMLGTGFVNLLGSHSVCKLDKESVLRSDDRKV